MALSQSEYDKLLGKSSTTNKNTNDVNWAVSMAAAVPSGIFKIFEG